MVKRNDACNYVTDSIDITNIEKYLREKRAEGMPGLGMLHLMTAAYVRLVAKYPGINRFVAGQRLYARHGIELVMTVKSDLKIDAPESSIKVTFDPSETIRDIYRKINEDVEKVKAQSATDTDNVARIFAKIPRLVLKFTVFFLNLLDYFGALPKAILRASPFHGSVIITDLGSIGLPPIYHHIYNFGNLPVFIAMGTKRKVYEVRKDGTVAEKKYIDISFVLDERVVDGFYFSQVYRSFRAIMKNPYILDDPPDEILRDID
ncbi:MAG: hypothetical protein GX823_02565 [Clostridiales bacterium]|nr:hypothetical protein [Clostridiales bacterium]